MIQAVRIAGYRGIRELTAEGFGRVNLVIGRNDCGKTAFMEALQLAEDAEDAVHRLLLVQRGRLRRAVKSHDFERFWQPIFFDFEAKIGLSISITHHDGGQQTLEMRQGTVSEEIISDYGDRRNIRERDDEPYESPDVVKSPTWALDLVIGREQMQIQQRVVGTPNRIKLPVASNKTRSAWITSGTAVGEDDIRFVSSLKQRGQDGSLLELLREVDGRLSGIELLSPGGEVAELFVRLDNGTPMLPVPLMGEGFQRCLEIGAAAAAHDWPTLFIDEIENDMHHLVLEPLWRWIATVSRRRKLQVFATTHSEECIQAACRAFQDLDDDGLRVIRLDRLEGGTRAAIYDRVLLEVAERTGTEIRG
jgi:predicted ATPase